MEILEVGTVVGFTRYDTEYVIYKRLDTSHTYFSFIDPKSFELVINYSVSKRAVNYIESLKDSYSDFYIVSHPCPKEIRPMILKMLNSKDEDTIKYAEAILKNY